MRYNKIDRNKKKYMQIRIETRALNLYNRIYPRTVSFPVIFFFFYKKMFVKFTKRILYYFNAGFVIVIILFHLNLLLV